MLVEAPVYTIIDKSTHNQYNALEYALKNLADLSIPTIFCAKIRQLISVVIRKTSKFDDLGESEQMHLRRPL